MYVTLQNFTPDLQKIYTDISAISVTFRNSGLKQLDAVVARCGPLYYFLKERSNVFGHLGHLGHFEKCQACLHMTMEVTSNMEVILKVIFV